MKHLNLFEVDGKEIEVKEYFTKEEKEKWEHEATCKFYEVLGLQEIKTA